MESLIQWFKFPRLQKFLDERNKYLWKSIIKEYSVTLKYNSDQSYLCYSKGNKSIIYVPKGDFCKDSFTHELLHVYLKVKKVFIGGNLLLQFRKGALLSDVYTEELLQQLGNCLDHHKMLPLYLELGFDRAKFITDYDIPKCADGEIYLIRMFLNDRSFRKEAADLYLGKFFCMKACPNNTIDYSKYFAQLEAIDKELYNILNRFWISFEAYDIENNDPVFNSYFDFCDLFVSELKQWTTNKMK